MGQLSPHFTLEELTATQHRGIDNTPTLDVLANLRNLAIDVLEPVRDMLGPLHVNSGYRSPELNRAVGGQPTSQHCQGLACDFVPLAGGLRGAVGALLESAIEYDQLIYEFGSWLHISRAPAGREPRRQALMVGKWTGGRYLPLNLAALP